MPHKTHNLIMAGIGVCLGMLPAMGHAPVVAVAAVSALVAAVVVMIGGRVLRRSKAFASWTYRSKATAVRWMWLAAGSDVAMVTVLQAAGIRYWPLWLAGVCLLVAVQVGVALLVEFLWRLPDPASDRSAEVAPGSALVPDHTRAVVRTDRRYEELTAGEKHMTVALTTVRHDWLKVVDGGTLLDSDESPFGAWFDLCIDAGELEKRGPDKCTPSATLAESLAIALSRQLGIRLQSRWVTVRKRLDAGMYRVTVTEEDINARIYPYVEPVGPASVRQPALVGYGIDAEPVYLDLRQHIRYIGSTRGGKTSLLHCVLAHLTRCTGNLDWADNCVVWIGGAVKVYDMLGGWLEVYLNTGLPMPFHWVATGPDDVGQMLVALMVAARYRQSVPMRDRHWPTIVAIFDEVSFTLGDKGITVTYQGRRYTLSQMASMDVKAVGSADEWIQYATQRGTVDEIGDEGGTIAAQTSGAAAFRNGDWQDVNRVIGDWKIDPPIHQGEYWLRGAVDADGPVLVKGRYIQEVDPQRPRLHGGLTLGDVSWSRRDRIAELDTGTDAALRSAVPAYADRSRLVNDEFMAYLTGVEVEPDRSTGPAPSPPGPNPESADWLDGDLGDPAPDDVAVEVARAAGVDLAAMSDADRRGFALAVGISMRDKGVTTAAEFLGTFDRSPVADEAPASASAEASTRAKRIVQIVATRPGVTSREVIAELRASGDECRSEVSVHNALKRLADGPLRKDDARKFWIREHAAVGDSR